jgi:glycosyltransferase involved in cell wall biosynthesis
MNILYTIRDLHIGGAANVLLQNVALLAKKHNVYLVYFGKNNSMVNRFSQYGVIPIHIKYSNLSKIYTVANKLRRILIDEKIDVVHANLFLDKMIVPIACRGLKIKKVATLHAELPSISHLTLKKKISIKFIFFILNNFYEDIIAVSEAAKISAQNIGGLKKNKGRVIYSGVKKMPIIAVKEPVFPEGTKIFGSSCRFDSVKGIPRMIRVFNKLNKKYPNTRLLLIGDGRQRSVIELEIKKHNLSEMVFITGFTNNVAYYLNQIDYYINASYSESLGLGAIEALSLSKPIIASNVGGLKEYIKDDFNGILVDFNDENSAYKKIKDFFDSSIPNYLKYSANSLRSYKEKFSVENYVQNLLEIYEN